MPTSTDPQRSDTEPTAEATAAPRPRRQAPGWLLAAGSALAVVAAVVLWRAVTDEPAPQRDLSTPEGAAAAFAGAAAAGDVDGVLAVTCLADAGCAAKHGGGVPTEQVAAAKKVIVENVPKIGARFGNARFATARAGAQPGTREVDYRLPGMPAGERHYLVFVEHDDRWLYIGTGGPTAPTPMPASPAPAT